VYTAGRISAAARVLANTIVPREAACGDEEGAQNTAASATASRAKGDRTRMASGRYDRLVCRLLADRKNRLRA